MKKEIIKIEIWDEDRGWTYACGNCQEGGDIDRTTKVCPHCHQEFTITERC